MSKFLDAAVLTLLLATPALAQPLGLGRPALPAEVAAWDIDIRPDGQGLPPGRGSVMDGEDLYDAQCAHCHGTFGEAVAGWPQLAGGHGTLTHERPEKTIGSYWPYLSTVWDYVHRAMPYGNAQSLTHDEVYAITAYLLYLNDLVDDDFELTQENFTEIRLPNEDGFYIEDMEAVEMALFRAEPCMRDCLPEQRITMRAGALDVTPDDPMASLRRAQARARAAADAGSGSGDGAQLIPAAPAAAVDVAQAASEPEPAPSPEPAAAPEPAAPAYTPAQVAAGEAAFRACRACHQVGEGARNGTGPALNGVYGAAAAHTDGFRYSPVLTGAAQNGLVWTAETLNAFLENPAQYLPRNRMSFRGVRSADERQALIAYLASFAE